MKKLIYLVASVLVVSVIALGLSMFNATKNTTKKDMGFANSYNNVIKINSNATTSPITLIPTGTTSFTFASDGVSKMNLLLQFQGSSTLSVLNWTREYSDNGIDWYGEDNMTQSSNILGTHGSTTVVHSWSPSSASMVRKSIIIEPLALWSRITFTGVTATSTLYVKAITQVLN